MSSSMNHEEPVANDEDDEEFGFGLNSVANIGRFGNQEKIELPQVTVRATVVGLVIGTVVLISNFQFGLQTGWVSMMSLPSALLGFAIFRATPLSKEFSDVENVYIQSVAVAVGTGPLAYGLIGIIPAIEKFLTEDETGIGREIQFSLSQLMVWLAGLAFFGVFFAVPLRKQVIIREKLPFPSGSATAVLISVLHGTKLSHTELLDKQLPSSRSQDSSRNTSRSSPRSSAKATFGQEQPSAAIEVQEAVAELVADNSTPNISSLIYSFVLSASYTVISYFVPALKTIPIMGSYLSKSYKWDLQPSPAYIGQGIIMGLPTVSYMLFGAILGWGILAPIAKYMKWAPGKIDSYVDGGQGWILWISLSIMISDSLVSFAVVIIKSLNSGYIRLWHYNEFDDANSTRPLLTSETDTEATLTLDQNDDSSPNNRLFPKPGLDNDEVDAKYLVSNKTVVVGVILSSLLCIVSMRAVFGKIVPHYTMVIAVVLALLFSIMGVRALGETDLNPVSGIGKLSQFIFALVVPASHPSKVLINLIAGGIAEAGAQQAGDLMQDLQTGHMVGASPFAQFIAQLAGTIYSVVLSSVMYKAYNLVYTIPSDVFRIPTAVIWVDCSRLVTGEGLPPRAFEFSIIFGSIFAAISIVKNVLPKTSKHQKYLVYLPNGVAVGIGIYNTPNFTLARFIGGLGAFWWLRKGSKNFNRRSDEKTKLIILSSGLVLGEGLFSGFTMLLTSMGVKHL